MPELPEVETIRRQLSEKIVGYTVVSLTTNLKKQFRPSFSAVRKAVVGKVIKNITRRAKLLSFELSSGEYLLVHLKMTGSLLVRRPEAEEDGWQHAVFVLRSPRGDNLELRWCDLRQFGYLQVASREERDGIWGSYGPEPLAGISTAYLQEKLSRRSVPIKQAIMDQKVLAGVGNIYANEVLFSVGLAPQVPANKLTVEQIKDLASAIEKILRQSIKLRGTTAKDERYVDARGAKGGFQKQLQVYGRAGQPCPRCGHPISKIKLGGRGTYFCEYCQPAPPPLHDP